MLHPHMMMARAILALLVTISPLGCADSGFEGARARGARHAVTIWNRSQFDILEVSLVDVPAVYDDEPGASVSSKPIIEARERVELWTSQEAGALAQEEAFLAEEFVSGARVAFVRERASVGDELLEVVSVEAFELGREGYILVLFDDSFRLLDPDSTQRPERLR